MSHPPGERDRSLWKEMRPWQSSMRWESISARNPEEHQQVRRRQKGGAYKGGRNQEERGEAEDLCITEAKERKKWSDVSNAEEKSVGEGLRMLCCT